MIIKIETSDLTEPEADNLMECMLIHYGWASFVDKVFIGTKKVYDCSDEKDQKFVHFMLEEKMNRFNRIKSSNSASQSLEESLIADKQNPQHIYICPKCKGRCIERLIGKSKVYDCQDCNDQISSEAIIVAD